MLLNEVLLFVRTVEHKSISAASRSLGISTGAASTRLIQLERHLGVKLLARTTRSLAPTDAGSLFYGHALEVLAAAEQARNSIVDFSDAPRGVLRLCAPLGFGRHVLAPLITQFQSLYPHIEVRLRLSERNLDLFSEDVDAAIRIGEHRDSSLIVRKLVDCPQILCASPSYLLCKGVPAEPLDLLSHNCLLLRLDGKRSKPWLLHTTAGPQALPVSGRLEADDGDVLTQWAIQGEGIVLQPRWAVEASLSRGELMPILESYSPETIAVSLLYPHRRLLAAKIKLFADFLVSRTRLQIEGSRTLAA